MLCVSVEQAMRPANESKKYRATKELSQRNGKAKLIIESRRKREFFRFEDGELVEYDLTKLNGNQISLTSLEREVIKELEYQPLS